MNIILITLDAMRKDSLGIYNNKKSLTPSIDRIARQSVVFDNAVTVANSTCPGHVSIFTGQSVMTHEIRENGWMWKNKVPLIAEIFAENNYETCGVSSIEFLSTYYKMNKGFKKFYNNNPFDKWNYWLTKPQIKIGRYRFRLIAFLRRNKLIPLIHSRRANETNTDAVTWIKKNSKKDFFIWIQYMTGHLETRELYEEKTRVVDKAYNELIETLKTEGILDRTMIVHMADHGEAFHEHEWRGHSWYLYDEELMIPFFIYYPEKFRFKRIPNQVRTIDMMPTILELAGIKYGGKTDGKSLVPLIEGKEDFKEDAFCECYPVHRISHCIRTYDGWKYIASKDRENELFNLNEDPEEKNNLAGKEKTLVQRLHERLEKWIFIDVSKNESKIKDF